MILVSTKSVFESGTRHSTIYQKIYNSVIEAHKNRNTIYIMDTLYGKTLKRVLSTIYFLDSGLIFRMILFWTRPSL